MTKGFVLAALAATALAASGVSAGCSSDVTQPAAASVAGTTTTTTSTTGTGGAGGGGGSGGGGGVIPQSSARVDILLMVDNSRSMADKQSILASAVPDLVSRLANPLCLDGNGAPAATQPAGPLEACPPGSTREFAPITDMHIGTIDSSLGGHGSDACSTQNQPTNNDHGHLLARSSAMSMGNDLPTYQNKGFLAWDPKQVDVPPGEKDLPALDGAIEKIVVGVDQVGCGFESQLESWYRFLVDPDPYQSLSLDASASIKVTGTDVALLQQRKDFLRDDSLVLILALTDENDCSTKEYGQLWISNQIQSPSDPTKRFHLPPARQECQTNPNDPCCMNCQQPQGACPPDPTCNTPLDDVTDNVNLRCFDQKRRFGIDFLYPIDRYTQALTSVQVPDRSGQLVPNPLFSGGRNASLVFFAGIVGVPWQDIARDPNDITKGLKSAKERNQQDAQGHSTWDIVLGDPDQYVDPLDPLMIESVIPRSGTNPVIGAPTGAAGQNTPLSNPINGKEWDIVDHDDLEYACVFDLPMARDCSQPGISCDCMNTQATNMPPDSPVCVGQMQVKAKSYPGRRELSLIESLGDQGIVGSVCAKNVVNPNAPDFGYRATMSAIVEAIAPRFSKP